MNFVDSLINFESSGKNVTNVNQTTSSGRARGFFQITDQTWQDFGRRVGIDLAKYPTALSAPREIQAQVAGAIPLKRWDPITLRRMTAAGFTFDPEKTLAENAAAHGEKMYGPTPAAASVVTGAGQSTGDYVSPATPVPGATQPNFTPTGADPNTSKIDQSLAGVFGNALGKASFGSGDAGGSSGGGNVPPGEEFNLPVQSATGDLPPPGAAPDLSPLANLFALPTIGQPVPKLNIASRSWT